MKIKRFFAQDIRSALDEIKVVLGPDAIIMSNKKVDGGVEIVAAIDDDNIAAIAKSSSNLQPKTQQKLADKPVAEGIETTGAAQAKAPVLQRHNSMREIGDDQVSLSGFQQRLVQQQIQAQADQLIGNEPAAIKPADLTSPEREVERRQADSSSRLPAWAQAGSMAPKATHAESAQQHQATSLSQAGFNRKFNNQQINPLGNVNDSQAIDELRQEMASMRQLLQHQVNGLIGQDVARRDPTRSMLLQQLIGCGFDTEVAKQLVIEIPLGADLAAAKDLIAEAITKRLMTTNNDVIEQGGVVALLGPTGVGKTTTIAKLAARYAMEFGSEQVALITTDSYRIGAFEQLNTYGKILGCPVKVAKDAQQLADVLYQLRNKRLVLIDTAGMGQRDIRLSEQLNTLVNTSHVNIRSYLVLPATAQRKVLQEAIEQFRKIPISGCIMTKMDEALGAAEVLSVAIGHSLPIGYVTNGQRVPEDIGIVDIKMLVQGVIEQLDDNGLDITSASSAPAQFVSFNR